MKNIIPEDNLSYSVLLSIDSKSNGSGFRLKYEDKNYLITAKHVLFTEDGVLRGNDLLITCQTVGTDHGDPIILKIDLKEAKIFKSKKDDVAAILLGHNEKLYDHDTLLKDIRTEMKRPTTLIGQPYVKLVSGGGGRAISLDLEATRRITEIKIANDVYLMGYPTSLGLQRNKYFDYSKPLLRKGIIAGINLKQNTFIIDCPAYQGNSGGPVVEDCEDDYFRVIGLVSMYIPYETKWYSNRDQVVNTELSNSGYSVCVPIDAVLDLLSTVKKNEINKTFSNFKF